MADENPLMRIARSVGSVIRGQEGALRLVIVSMVAGGHVLLEDVPGAGKTTLAKGLALSLAARFKRIQFTPDLLPSDIIGVSIYDPSAGAFRFHEGPLFAHIVLADEINRASPRTQSALLEAMAEGQVSVDGSLRPLEEPFFVIATQNPVESHGTYPLPEAQMDRFAVRLRLGYVTAEEEAAILADQQFRHPLADVTPCVTLDEMIALRKAATKIRIAPEIMRYIVDLAAATRIAEGVRIGASPRASLALMKLAQGAALFDGDEFVTPDHVRELAAPVMAHRLLLDGQARYAGTTGEQIVARVVETVKAPA